jgi:chorismate mutase/GNAT superfamily N-acetyltransferase
MPTEPDLRLRQAEPGEATALADLYTRARVAAVPSMPAALHTDEEDRGWFTAKLAAAGHEAWVAERAGDLVGYALLDHEWLDHLFISPDVTGGGVGTALLDLVKSLRPNGFCLWVFATNEGARRFYRRHGLVELEHTDGSSNEEKAPDIRMAWPGTDPVAFFRGLIDDVDGQLGDLLSRRAALTAAVQRHKADPTRDLDRERAIAVEMSRRAPALGPDRLAHIVHAIITESLDAAAATDS